MSVHMGLSFILLARLGTEPGLTSLLAILNKIHCRKLMEGRGIMIVLVVFSSSRYIRHSALLAK